MISVNECQTIRPQILDNSPQRWKHRNYCRKQFLSQSNDFLKKKKARQFESIETKINYRSRWQVVAEPEQRPKNKADKNRKQPKSKSGLRQFRSVSFSPRVTSTHVNFMSTCQMSSSTRFIIYVFLYLTYFMCFNIYIFARDLYLKVLTEGYGEKNCVMQIRQFIERTFMFMYMC